MTVNAATLERLGRYEVLGEIASGGMATVFLGRVTGAKGFQRLVAIKRLHPHLESEEDFVAMFLDEARLAAKIRHQNVVGTLDVEDQEGLYIVMEYIEGDRLLGLLRHAAKNGERIPLAVAVRIALDTLAGLHAAHELHDDDGEPIGLVHRDVSPQNILIGVDGVARLTDFGIAKATSRLTVTRDGQLKGKIAYMAPEQTKRVEIDRRVDLFAMGIITWEMLTSKKLFTGESDVEVLNQLLFEPIPRLKESAPGIPAAIDAAVMRALERDPAKRYATAAEFADALERASKVIGGPANARTVAAHLQKVSADKIAKDRARVASAGTPGTPADGTASRVQRRPTGSFPAVNTGQHANPIPSDVGDSAPRAAPPMPPPPPNTPARRPTMVGMAAPPPFAPPARPTPSVPPPQSAPSVTAEHTLIDDDEDIPTQAVVRTKDMAEALGVANRARPAAGQGPAVLPPASRSPTGSMPAVSAPRAPATGVGPAIPRTSSPAISATPSAPANAAPAVGPPAVPLTRPVSVPPPTAADSLPEIPEAPPSRGRATLILAMLIIAIAGGVGAFVIMQRGNPTTAVAPSPHTPTPTPTVEPPTPTPTAETNVAANPVQPVAEPTGNTQPPANPPAVAANPQPPANTPPVVAPVAPTPPVVAPVAPTPPVVANAPAPATPPPTVANPPPPTAHATHPAHVGHAAAPHPTPAGTTTAPHPTPHGSANDDPFGTDNPYQR